MSKTSPLLLIALALGGCGGGESSSTVVPPTPVAEVPAAPAPASPALSFAPAILTASFSAGTSQALSAAAVVARPADFAGVANVYAYVVDDSGVILPTALVTQTSAGAFSVRMSTVPTLSLGAHKGSFTIKLCKDSACATQFAGSPVALPYELTVTAPALPQITAAASAPLAMTARAGVTTTTDSVVTLTAAGRNWTLASAAAWLKPAATSGSGNTAVAVKIDPTGMNAGTYTADLTFKSDDGQSATVPASLTVLPSAFSISGSGMSFYAVNGAPIAAQALKFALNNNTASPWSASADANWLTVDPTSGTTPATANLSVNANAGLASGSYSSTLTFTSPYSNPAPFTVNLNLVAPTLALSTNSLIVGGANGRNTENVPVKLTLNTETNLWPWTLSERPAWLQAYTSAGRIGQAGATVLFNKVQTAPVGTSNTTLTFTAKVNGDTVTAALPVTVNRDERKLVPDETTVALAATPGWSRLSRTIKIRDNFKFDSAWTASSDQPWLTVTASGSTAGATPLTVSADPASLPVDRISYATVTLTPPAGVSAPEVIKVALWKGSTTPAAPVRIAARYTNMVIDPLRPLVYVNNGAVVDVYNVYTGVRINSLGAVGAALGAMAVSPNGDFLYTFDTANRAITVINLATNSKVATWAMPGTAGPATADSRMIVMRPNGVEVVITNNHGSYLASSGAQIGTLAIGGDLAASGDSQRLFNSGASAFSVDYAAVNGGTLLLTKYASGSGYYYGSNSSVAANFTGSKVYVPGGSTSRCTAYSGDDGTEIGGLPGPDASPNNVKVASDGRIFCGVSSYYGVADVWINRPDGTVQTSLKFALNGRSLQPRLMAVSADALMLVGVTDDPSLVFVPVGP